LVLFILVTNLSRLMRVSGKKLSRSGERGRWLPSKSHTIIWPIYLTRVFSAAPVPNSVTARNGRSNAHSRSDSGGAGAHRRPRSSPGGGHLAIIQRDCRL